MSLNNVNIIASQRVGLSTTPKIGNKYQIMAGNRFRRVVTLTNSGSALTNTLIAIPVDHRGIYQTDRKDKHTTRTFNDLRVYQSNGVTPIPFYLEGVDTHSCSIFMRINIPTGSSTIIIEYGNPALEALSDTSVVPATITDNSTIFGNWSATHLTSGAEVIDVDDGLPVMNLHNSNTRGGSFIDLKRPASNAPIYSRTGANGHASLVFSSGKDLRMNAIHQYSALTSTQEISIYLVSKASTLTNYQSAYRNQTSNYVVYPFGASAQFIMSSDGGVGGGINSGVVPNVWNITSAHYKKNTTNGMRTYRNNTLVAQRNSINADIHRVDGLTIGSFAGAEQFIGEIAQIIVCYDNNFDGTPQTNKRNDIYEYLNARYRQYAGLQDVSISVGTESDIYSGTGYTYEYYSGVSKYTLNSKIEGDIGSISPSSADIEILNVFDTTLVDSHTEYWTNSTTSTQQLTNTEYEREIDISATAIIDSVRIANYDKSYNRATFNQWQVEDNVDNTTYSINDDDELIFALNCETGADITGTVRLYNKNIAPFDSSGWWYNNVNITSIDDKEDPFFGSRGVAINTSVDIGNNVEFLVFASSFGLHPTPLPTYNGINTASIWVKSNKQIYIAQWGSGYANYVQSTAHTGDGKWQRLQVSTTDAGANYESFAIRSANGFTASDELLIYSPTLTKGAVATYHRGNCDYIADIPTLTDGLNWVRIPRSQFVGTGAFSQIEFMELELESTSNQTIQYSQFQYVKNYNLESKYSEGSLVDITLASSDDDRATFDILPISNQIIDKKYINEETSLKTVDYISLLKGIKFKDLPSWHGNNMIFSYVGLVETEIHKHMIHEILSMIFPSNFIDTDTLTNDTDVSSLRYTYLAINKEELVVDVISAILKANVGVLRFNPDTSKIQYVSGTSLFTQDSKIVTDIVEYNNDTRDTKIMYNRIRAIPLYATINNVQSFVESNYLGGFGGGSYVVQNHAVPYAYDTIRIPLTEFAFNGISYDILPFVQKVELAGFNFSTSSGGNVYDNSFIRISKIEIIDNNVVMNVYNYSGAKKYLVNCALYAQFASYIRPNVIFNPNVDNEYILDNVSSQNAVGIREYELDQRFVIHDFNIETFPTLYDMLFDVFGNSDRYISLTNVKTSNIQCGDLVECLDVNKRPITGVVVELSQDDDFSQQVKLRVV